MSKTCSFPLCRRGAPDGEDMCVLHKKHYDKKDVAAVAPTNNIAKVSESMKDQLKVYKKLAKEFLKKNYRCQVKGCNHASQCVHHMAGRVGENLTDVRKFLAVCFEHHRQIEENPDWSYENGYSLSRLSTEPNNAA